MCQHNKGDFRANRFVICREVVLFSKVVDLWEQVSFAERWFSLGGGGWGGGGGGEGEVPLHTPPHKGQYYSLPQYYYLLDL